MTRLRVAAAAVAVGYTVFVGSVTLAPHPYGDDVGGFVDALLAAFSHSRWTSWITFGRLESIANIGLFVPWGVAATLAVGARRWWAVAWASIVFSILIETWQLLVFPETRVASLADVAANSIGGFLGAFGVYLVGKRSERTPADLVT